MLTRREKLLVSLLKISSNSYTVFDRAIDKIVQTLECHYGALWMVNSDSKTMSLVCYSGVEQKEHYSNPEMYVHKISGSFTSSLLPIESNENVIHISNLKSNQYFKNHKSKLLIDRLGCNDCIVIPIPLNKRTDQKFVKQGILYLYPSEKMSIDDEYIEIIRTYFSLAISNYDLLRKEKLTNEIIELHNKRGNKDIGSIMHPIITRILKNHIKYEAGSVFIYDSFLNHLVLAATTGISGKPAKKDVYYNLGHGFTGMVGLTKEKMILHSHIDDLESHKGIWNEIKPNKTQSLLMIPIVSTVDNALLGVLRFTNRINPVSNAIDYFNQQDVEDISHVSYLISLYMEFDRIDTAVDGFSKQLIHETITPAVGIRGAADNLIRYINNEPDKLDRYLKDYCLSIFEYSQLQIAQSDNILYAWQKRKDKSKRDLYDVDDIYSIQDIIHTCKKLVFPILRDENLKFDDIKIIGNFPNLYIDKYAFEPVFLNLIRNTIKYRKRKRGSTFNVDIRCHEASDFIDMEGNPQLSKGFYIDITDFGIGINIEETEKIFLMGYRGASVSKTNLRGLGIGLTVCVQVLKDFYCKIWVHSRENPTTFRIFVPKLLENNDYTMYSYWTKKN